MDKAKQHPYIKKYDLSSGVSIWNIQAIIFQSGMDYLHFVCLILGISLSTSKF